MATARPLTPKQARFVHEYLVDLNATAAARRAGYSAANADKIGPELLGKTRVAEAIQAALADRAARTQVTADRVVRELALVALGDPRELFTPAGTLKGPHEWTAEQAALVASIEVVEEHDGSGTDRVLVGHRTRIKRWDKVKSLELLAKHLGMFTEKVEVVTSTRPPEEALTDAELDDRIRRLAGDGPPGGPAGAAPSAGGAGPAGGPG